MSYSTRTDQKPAQLNYPKGMLAGQVAIITGSGQGIGAETARLFANEGAKVVVSDIDADKAKNVANQINESGGSAIAVAGDMLSDSYINELVKKAADFGNGKIHIIVNNAGFTWDGVLHKVTIPSSCMLESALTTDRQPTSNGTQSLPSTTPHHSSSFVLQHHTSV